MLCCIYALNAYIKMPSKCTQIYTHSVVMRIVVGFFQWFFPLWISLPETWRDGCPGRWDLRVLEVCVVNRWKLLVSYCPSKHLMSHKYIQSWHTPFAIIQTSMHMYISICGQNTLNTFSYLDMDLPLTVHCTPSPPSVFSFFLHFFVCRHITPWNVFKIKSHLGLVIYKGSESTNLLADIKLSTCILETQLRLSISLNNPCCPPPSDNTHWILQRHYLQSEVTRHNPSPGRGF